MDAHETQFGAVGRFDPDAFRELFHTGDLHGFQHQRAVAFEELTLGRAVRKELHVVLRLPFFLVHQTHDGEGFGVV